MDGLSISVKVNAGAKIPDALDRAAKFAKNPAMAAKAAAAWIAGETFRIFSQAYNVNGPWADLSKITLFLRKHRANFPRASNTPGSDTGRLKGSFTPFSNTEGTEFGAGTNVEYADDFNNGGPSKANIVAIAGFTRRLRTGDAVGIASGKTRGVKSGRVRDYLMHMKDGNNVPARQFFPKGTSELQSWGYTDKIREIFKIDFDKTVGGEA